jgi:DMSO/TMAO reductase YedYZ molybdopterin-dependent catalytic subunit
MKITSCFSTLIAFGLLVSGQTNPVLLTVTGDLTTPLKLTADDLAKMPHKSVTVEEPDGSKATYAGVSLLEVLQRAGAPLGGQLRKQALASYLLVKAKDGYQVVFTLAEIDPQFANELILLADKRNGAALPANQGPLRLEVGNDKVGARSVRMLESIEFVRLQK